MKNTTNLQHLKTLAFPLVTFSFISNLAVLVSPIFMMQVLDRVVPSGNLNTLALLLLVAFIAIATQGLVEFFRDVCLVRTSQWVEVCGTSIALEKPQKDKQAIIDDTSILSQFFQSGQAVVALNVPWLPLFALALALINPMFLVLVSMIVGAIFSIKFAFNFYAFEALKQTQNLSKVEHQVLLDANDSNIISGMRSISENLNDKYKNLQTKRHLISDQITQSSALKTSSIASIRMFAQILALSLGAYLVVRGDITSGGMIGASIIVSKTIGTFEGCINGWPNIKAAFASFRNLSTQQTPQKANTEIDTLSGKLTANDLTYPRGGGAQPRLERVSFSLNAGECLAIVGDSGSGKTTLLHALGAIDPCPIGAVFYDESEIRILGPETARKSIGYLAQQARLQRGTLAENISCFQLEPDDKKIINAAKTSGVHGLISSLPQAYETDMGQHSYLLSAGQKQRVALARAIYEHPKYLFLDEPNALLDAAGERQLCDTLAQLKKQGTTIVMVLHRSGIMGLADKILALQDGRMSDFGPRAEVLGRMNDGKQRIKLPLNPASLQDLNDWVVAQFLRHSDKEFCQKTVIVATELFNAAHQNGARDIRRECTIIFRFIDENKCELMLTEDAHSKAEAKMLKINASKDRGEINMLDLDPDEIALAMVAQITEKLEVKNLANSSLFAARLTSDKHCTKARLTH